MCCWASGCVFTSALRHKEKNHLKHAWKIGLLSPKWLRKCSPLWLELTHRSKAGADLVLCVDCSILAPVLEAKRIEWCLYLPSTPAKVLKNAGLQLSRWLAVPAEVFELGR